MSTAAETIINSVIELTEQRQLKSLAESLVSTMKQTFCISDVAFVNVDSKIHFPVKLLPGGDKFNHSTMPDCVRQCIDDKRPVAIEENGNFMVAVPILMQGAVVKVLWVQAPEALNEHQQFMLRSFARIYENFFNIVLDSETDSLTGLLNKKAFYSQVATAMEQDPGTVQLADNRHSEPGYFWLVIFDVDKFKKINDTFGHLYGDEILLLVANTMAEIFDESDLLFRFGGDEFVVLMSPRTKAEARAVLQAFQQAIAGIKNDKLWQVTCSMGGVNASGAENPSDLLVQADRALYYVKEHGRAQVAFYCDLLEQGELANAHFDDDIELF